MLVSWAQEVLVVEAVGLPPRSSASKVLVPPDAVLPCVWVAGDKLPAAGLFWWQVGHTLGLFKSHVGSISCAPRGIKQIFSSQSSRRKRRTSTILRSRVGDLSHSTQKAGSVESCSLYPAAHKLWSVSVQGHSVSIPWVAVSTRTD